MDCTDANSIGMLNDDSQPRLRVVSVYPLDGMPVSNSIFWISVIQFKREKLVRLFLRVGHQHRSISVRSALRLLPYKAGKELSSLLKLPPKKDGGGEKAILYGIITPFVFNEKQNKYRPDKKEISGDINKPYITDGTGIELTTYNQASVSAAVDEAQLKGWGAINVSGSDYVRKQLWIEAASRGMHVEGYQHAEEDRALLITFTPQSSRHLIKPEYKPVGLNVSDTHTKRDLSSIKRHKKQAVAESSIGKPAEDLTEQELTYLLMRIQQLEHSKAEALMANQAHQLIHRVELDTDDLPRQI